MEFAKQEYEQKLKGQENTKIGMQKEADEVKRLVERKDRENQDMQGRMGRNDDREDRSEQEYVKARNANEELIYQN